ncbi:MAG: flagellar biosynthesis protein FlhB [Thermodesulfobacteriota bacterium]
MAEENSGQEKTEEPTARRLKDARDKGDIAKSMEIPSALVLLSSILTLYGFSTFFMEQFYRMLKHYLTNLHAVPLGLGDMSALTLEGMRFSLVTAGPVMLVVLVVGLLANVGQFGFLFTTEKLTPKLSKIDPIQGFARMFSLQMLANSVKSIMKVVIIGYVAYREIMRALPGLNPLMDQEVLQIAGFIGQVSFRIFLKAALILIVLAMFDYAFQRWEFMKKMRMTKQEMKEEAKQTEGDPHVKGRIRAIQMEMARRRMMEEVPKADVVITNPTRLAIALRYDSMSMHAPKVVAKGAGAIAQRIREVAREHGVPLVENKPLAQALFKQVKIDDYVPENLFQAVAEVLAYVYGLKRKSA